MKKIYFAGSIRGGRDDKDLYAEIIEKLKKYGEVLTEHLGDKTLSVMGEYVKKSDFIYNRDIEWLKTADIVISEVTNPSLGVGYELAYAEKLNIPVVCLYRPSADKKLSAMIEGNKNFNVFEYQKVQDLDEFFIKIFN
jgi:nucleoside 2-deoxyribosyltransferase